MGGQVKIGVAHIHVKHWIIFSVIGKRIESTARQIPEKSITFSKRKLILSLAIFERQNSGYFIIFTVQRDSLSVIFTLHFIQSVCIILIKLNSNQPPKITTIFFTDLWFLFSSERIFVVKTNLQAFFVFIWFHEQIFVFFFESAWWNHLPQNLHPKIIRCVEK